MPFKKFKHSPKHVENTNSTFSEYKHETNVIKLVFII